jgi:hypothetical protein
MDLKRLLKENECFLIDPSGDIYIVFHFIFSNFLCLQVGIGYN